VGSAGRDDGDNEHLEHGDTPCSRPSMSIRSTAVTSSRTRVIRSPVARLSNQRSGNCSLLRLTRFAIVLRRSRMTFWLEGIVHDETAWP